MLTCGFEQENEEPGCENNLSLNLKCYYENFRIPIGDAFADRLLC
jgi:hypothetical protein